MTAGSRLFVITGGPGSGKTTLCEALVEHDIMAVAESGRAVIRDQQEIAGSALPWIDPQLFAAAILKQDLDQYQWALDNNQTCLFDRGFPDNAGYLTMLGFDLPIVLESACRNHRYAQPVFVAPPWQDIFCPDSERRQDWDEAVRTHEAVTASYKRFGYDLITLPLASVAERVRFVLGYLLRDQPK